MSEQIQLWLAMHARCIAEMNHFIAQANRDLHRGEWLCDWSIPIDMARETAERLEREIQAAIDAAKEVSRTAYSCRD